MKLERLLRKLFKPGYLTQLEAEEKENIRVQLVKLGALKAQADAILADIDDKIRSTCR